MLTHTGATGAVALHGDLLAAGGFSSSSTLASTELYSNSAGIWNATGSLATARYLFQMVLLPNGNILAAGGYSKNGILASAEV